MNELFSLNGLSDLLDWHAILYVLLCIVILALGGIVYSLLRRVSLKHELTQNDNPASAISFAGFLAAIGIVLVMVLRSPGAEDLSLTQDVIETALWSLGAILLLVISLFVNDKLLFPTFSNRKEILTDRNVGLGAAEAASFISTALVMGASFSEQSSGTSPIGEPWLTLIYFVLGQLTFLLYCRVYQTLAKFDLHAELEQDNPAVGVAIGGSMVAFAILLFHFVSTFDSILLILIGAIVSAAFLALIRWITHSIVFRGITLDEELRRDRNWGIGIIEASVSIALALLVVSAL